MLLVRQRHDTSMSEKNKHSQIALIPSLQLLLLLLSPCGSSGIYPQAIHEPLGHLQALLLLERVGRQRRPPTVLAIPQALDALDEPVTCAQPEPYHGCTGCN